MTYWNTDICIKQSATPHQLILERHGFGSYVLNGELHVVEECHFHNGNISVEIHNLENATIADVAEFLGY